MVTTEREPAFAFTIQEPDAHAGRRGDSPRTYLLVAASEDRRREWVIALQKLLLRGLEDG